MRIRWLAALATALGLCGAASAQPATPTVEVRLQSVNVLLDKAEYVAGLGGKEDVVQAVKQILKGLSAEGKGIEGIDPKRPFGAYATLSADVVNSPLMLMVPIADQDRLLQMLKDRLDITPEKVEGGALKVDLPEGVKNPVIESLYLRFANDYLYVARAAKDLDPKALIVPTTFFAKDDGAVASVIVRGDKIPAEVKTFVIGQFELLVAEQRKKNGPGEKPAEKIILDFLGEGAAGGIKSLFEDSKELAVRVFIDEKADEMSAEVVLTPKAGTPMAKYFGSLAGKTSLPAGIVTAKDAVARGSVKIAMTPELKQGFSKVIDALIVEGIKDAPAEAKEHIERVVKTLAPTVKAGALDLAIGLYGPDAKGRHSLLAAAAIKDGKEIEKLVKEFSQFAAAKAEFTFDVDKVGDFNLHKVVINEVPPEVEKIFGTKTVWLALSDTHLVASMEPDGAAIKAGLKAKAITVPVLSVEVSLAKVFPLAAKNLPPDDVKALLKDTFGDGSPAGKDTVTVTITGGDQLTAKAKVKGRARASDRASCFQRTDARQARGQKSPGTLSTPGSRRPHGSRRSCSRPR